MPKTSKPALIVMPTLQEHKTINDAAQNDPDIQPLTPKQLTAMVPLGALWGNSN